MIFFVSRKRKMLVNIGLFEYDAKLFKISITDVGIFFNSCCIIKTGIC